MKLRAKEAEALFAAAYGMGPEHQVAFRRRLEHLRTYGCPQGLATGRGRPAVYTWLQLVQQSLALELVEVGLTPERAARLAIGTEGQAHLYAASLAMAAGSCLDPAAWILKSEWPKERNMFLLGRAGELSGMVVDNRSNRQEFMMADCAKLMEWLDRDENFQSTMIVINLGSIVASLIRRLTLWTECSLTEVVESYFGWALSYEPNR